MPAVTSTPSLLRGEDSVGRGSRGSGFSQRLETRDKGGMRPSLPAGQRPHTASRAPALRAHLPSKGKHPRRPELAHRPWGAGGWLVQRSLQGWAQGCSNGRIQKTPFDCFRQERKYSQSQTRPSDCSEGLGAPRAGEGQEGRRLWLPHPCLLLRPQRQVWGFQRPRGRVVWAWALLSDRPTRGLSFHICEMELMLAPTPRGCCDGPVRPACGRTRHVRASSPCAEPSKQLCLRWRTSAPLPRVPSTPAPRTGAPTLARSHFTEGWWRLRRGRHVQDVVLTGHLVSVKMHLGAYGADARDRVLSSVPLSAPTNFLCKVA